MPTTRPVEKNRFIEGILRSSIMRKLSDEGMFDVLVFWGLSLS